ncbi:helix-turn-helix transcriptional regulator [Burkholderia sp. Bp8963]|uniref:helix-turn-helix transcriptional regulator n=1 Tax=Burkholderia sp. Bp8963 TaxID=2184547 RepID=UPI0021AB2E97|nr:helix-turn-helix transcriptional regulator [Burkholderia sp. Bp8963]
MVNPFILVAIPAVAIPGNRRPSHAAGRGRPRHSDRPAHRVARPAGLLARADPADRRVRAGRQLDPFYIANREAPQSGLFRLSDVAPECFRDTDYYTRYFTHNVVEDEVQYNARLDDTRTLCLSLGSKQRFSPEQVALLDLMRPWVSALMRQRLGFEREPAEPAPARAAGARGRFELAMARLGTPLTARELDVVRLILSGRSNKEVAGKLAISAETVKVHRRNIYGKLSINSQSELFSLFLKAQIDA